MSGWVEGHQGRLVHIYCPMAATSRKKGAAGDLLDEHA
jgi:hypothetical protein